MASEAYVYIVDTVDSSPYKAMSRQLSVNVSILYAETDTWTIRYEYTEWRHWSRATPEL
jgi:surfactin synthase thioesterase subunit